MLEASLMAPFIFLLFIGIFDMGFYSYAIICTANASRVAARYTSGSSAVKTDSSGACSSALLELQALPNIPSGTACSSITSPCTGYGLSNVFCVAASDVSSGPDGADASKVSVTYQSLQLFPLPWLTGKLTITRSSTFRVKPS